jgi:hypothetical protein
MNKKAGFILTGELMLWIPRLLLLVISLLAITWILGSYVNRSSDTTDVEFYVLSNRLFYSKNCFSYDSKSIIDINRFDQNILENCIDFGNNVGSKLTLSYNDKNIEILTNKDLFSRGFYTKDLKNKQYKYKNKKNYVLVFDKDTIYSGLLNVEIVFKNE